MFPKKNGTGFLQISATTTTTTCTAIQASDEIKIVPQSHDSFVNGLDRYERRPDKGYSLPDCVSMNVMEAEGMTQALTSDRNFEQEGFTILMKDGG